MMKAIATASTLLAASCASAAAPQAFCPAQTRCLASAVDFQTTLFQLQETLDKRGLKTFAIIDHAAGAASIDAALRPTTLVIFGNPKAGTPVIGKAQTMGLELPLKILVMEDAKGAVHLVAPQISHIAENHGLTPEDVAHLDGAIEAIAADAAASRP